MKGTLIQLEDEEQDLRIVFPREDGRSGWTHCFEELHWNDYERPALSGLGILFFTDCLSCSVFLPIELVYLGEE